jgi:predicted oxidoreductase
LQDWLGTAGFDRPEDYWPRRWAEAYIAFAAGEKRPWLHAQGVRFFPVVGWAERGGYGAIGHGNSVPRFHLIWGTGPGVVAPFERRVREAASRGLITWTLLIIRGAGPIGRFRRCLDDASLIVYALVR